MRGNKLIILPILAALIIANMAATVSVRADVPPPEYLYVNSFSATYVDWTAVGASPYLDAPGDGSYIEGTTDGASMGMFGFDDIDIAEGYTVDKVWLEGYTDGPYSGNVDYDVYNAGGAWLGSLYGNGAPQWLRMRWIAPDWPTSNDDPSLLSEAGLNAWTCEMYFYDPGGEGGPGNIVDSLRLMVTFMEIPPPPIPFVIVNPEVSTGEVSETFNVTIEIAPDPYTPIYDLYGYEFKLAYNPAVITAMSIELAELGESFFPRDPEPEVPPDTDPWIWWNTIDNEAGIAWFSVTMPLGAEKGVSGSGVLAVITFHVEAVGVSSLDLHDTMMGNRYGIPITHIVKDGVFANSENFAVSIKTAQAEHRKFSVSKDEDGYQTLSAMVKNYGDVTETYVEFKIFDGMGVPIPGGAIYTPTVAIFPNKMTTLSASWNGFSIPEDYSVEARVYYMDQTGAWVVGQKGDPSGDKDLMTIGFTVEA